MMLDKINKRNKRKREKRKGTITIVPILLKWPKKNKQKRSDPNIYGNWRRERTSIKSQDRASGESRSPIRFWRTPSSGAMRTTSKSHISATQKGLNQCIYNFLRCYIYLLSYRRMKSPTWKYFFLMCQWCQAFYLSFLTLWWNSARNQYCSNWWSSSIPESMESSLVS